jgi:hypothetical protein
MKASFTNIFTGLTALAASVYASPVAQPEAALEARQSSALEGYMMAYLTGNDSNGEKIYFAASNGNNALSWTELNKGAPVLTSTMGTTGLRDPFIIRSPGTIHRLHLTTKFANAYQMAASSSSSPLIFRSAPARLGTIPNAEALSTSRSGSKFSSWIVNFAAL